MSFCVSIISSQWHIIRHSALTSELIIERVRFILDHPVLNEPTNLRLLSGLSRNPLLRPLDVEGTFKCSRMYGCSLFQKMMTVSVDVTGSRRLFHIRGSAMAMLNPRPQTVNSRVTVPFLFCCEAQQI